MNDLICDECGKAITDNQASVYVWNDWGCFKYLHIGACDDKSYRFSITKLREKPLNSFMGRKAQHLDTNL